MTKCVRIICSVCSGTGMRPFECGPAGATWTDYEQCFDCKGAGSFTRRIVGEQATPEKQP